MCIRDRSMISHCSIKRKKKQVLNNCSLFFSRIFDFLQKRALRIRQNVRKYNQMRQTDVYKRQLEEVGKEFNVTRERIRQIEAKALRKLRHPSRSRKLKDYLD